MWRRILSSFQKKRMHDKITAFLRNNVRHSIPSYALSLDDELYEVNAELLSLSIEAIKNAAAINYDFLKDNFRDGDTAKYLNVWPGEHYRLLGGIVKTMEPETVIEIGTATGASCLAMKTFLPRNGRIVTYDIVPWYKYPHTGLSERDFDSQLEQRVVDVTNPRQADTQRDLLSKADLLFIDAAKDGKMESSICELLDSIYFNRPPIVVFDDIRFISMLQIWRGIAHPKLDITSFGHWSGTGIVEWS